MSKQTEPRAESKPPKDDVNIGPPKRKRPKGGAVGAVIVVGLTPQGAPRKNWSKSEYAQDAIINLYAAGLPTHINNSKLTRDVNAWIALKHPDFAATHGAGKKSPIDRLTVWRALQAMRRYLTQKN